MSTGEENETSECMKFEAFECDLQKDLEADIEKQEPTLEILHFNFIDNGETEGNSIDNENIENEEFIKKEVGEDFKEENLRLRNGGNKNVNSPKCELSKSSTRRPRRSNKYIKCILCKYEAWFKKDMRAHDEVHKGPSGYFKCKDCTYENNAKYIIRDHVEAVHIRKGRTTMDCKICGYKAKSRNDKSKHSENHKSKENFKCRVCPIETKTASGMRVHMRTHSNLNNRFNCPLCKYRAISRRDMAQHNNSHKAKNECKIYKCDSCHFKTKYIRSMRGHTCQKRVCMLCKYEANTKEDMQDHDLSKHKNLENNFLKCPFCAFEGIRKHAVLEHIIHVHEKKGRSKIACKLCNYQGKSKKDFDKHNDKIHRNKNGNFHCNACAFETTSPHMLKSHMVNIHERNGLSKLDCKLCQYQAPNINTLRIHQEVHVREGNVEFYYCDKCNYKTRYKQSLRWHLFNHDKSINCNLFKTTESRFVCYWCGFEAQQKPTLASHIKHHRKFNTRQWKFTCFKCGFQTTSKTILLDHMETHNRKLFVKIDKIDRKYLEEVS